MVRPERFELPTFLFVGKWYRTQRFLFNTWLRRRCPFFGPFAVNWVGIWAGVFRGAEVSIRPSGSAMPGRCSTENPNLVRGLFSGLAAPVSPTPTEPRRCALATRPKGLGCYRDPAPTQRAARYSANCRGQDFTGVIFQNAFPGSVGLWALRRGGTPTKLSFWIHKRCGVDRESSPMTDSIPREPKGTSAVKL